MADNKPAAPKPQYGASPASFLTSPEWLKAATENQGEACRRLLDFSAARLRAQADFVQGLADCKSLPELLQRQTEFFEKAWTSYAGEATQSFGQAEKLWSGPGK